MAEDNILNPTPASDMAILKDVISKMYETITSKNEESNILNISKSIENVNSYLNSMPDKIDLTNQLIQELEVKNLSDDLSLLNDVTQFNLPKISGSLENIENGVTNFISSELKNILDNSNREQQQNINSLIDNNNKNIQQVLDTYTTKNDQEQINSKLPEGVTIDNLSSQGDSFEDKLLNVLGGISQSSIKMVDYLSELVDDQGKVLSDVLTNINDNVTKFSSKENAVKYTEQEEQIQQLRDREQELTKKISGDQKTVDKFSDGNAIQNANSMLSGNLFVNLLNYGMAKRNVEKQEPELQQVKEQRLQLQKSQAQLVNTNQPTTGLSRSNEAVTVKIDQDSINRLKGNNNGISLPNNNLTPTQTPSNQNLSVQGGLDTNNKQTINNINAIDNSQYNENITIQSEPSEKEPSINVVNQPNESPSNDNSNVEGYLQQIVGLLQSQNSEVGKQTDIAQATYDDAKAAHQRAEENAEDQKAGANYNEDEEQPEQAEDGGQQAIMSKSDDSGDKQGSDGGGGSGFLGNMMGSMVGGLLGGGKKLAIKAGKKVANVGRRVGSRIGGTKAYKTTKAIASTAKKAGIKLAKKMMASKVGKFVKKLLVNKATKFAAKLVTKATTTGLTAIGTGAAALIPFGLGSIVAAALPFVMNAAFVAWDMYDMYSEVKSMQNMADNIGNTVGEDGQSQGPDPEQMADQDGSSDSGTSGGPTPDTVKTQADQQNSQAQGEADQQEQEEVQEEDQQEKEQEQEGQQEEESDAPVPVMESGTAEPEVQASEQQTVEKVKSEKTDKDKKEQTVDGQRKAEVKSEGAGKRFSKSDRLEARNFVRYSMDKIGEDFNDSNIFDKLGMAWNVKEITSPSYWLNKWKTAKKDGTLDKLYETSGFDLAITPDDLKQDQQSGPQQATSNDEQSGDVEFEYTDNSSNESSNPLVLGGSKVGGQVAGKKQPTQVTDKYFQKMTQSIKDAINKDSISENKSKTEDLEKEHYRKQEEERKEKLALERNESSSESLLTKFDLLIDGIIKVQQLLEVNNNKQSIVQTVPIMNTMFTIESKAEGL